MMDWLRTLYLEQSSPDEVMIFLLLGGGLTLAVAFLVYALVLILLWRWREDGEGSVVPLLFPSRKRLREYAAEYLLAGSTALLLVLTVAARHDVVQTVLAQPVDTLTVEEIQRAFPVGAPTREDLLAAGAPESTAESVAASLANAGGEPRRGASAGEAARLTVEPLARSLLEAGLPENADALLNAVVAAVGDRITPLFPTREHLLILAVLFLLGYATWFAWRRSTQAGAASRTEPDYGEIARRLTVPALCVPLLLVSAVGAGNRDRIQKSAASVAAFPRPSEDAGPSWVSGVVEEQIHESRWVMTPEEVISALQRLDNRVAGQGERIRGLGNDLRSARDAVLGLRQALSNLVGRLERDSSSALAEHISFDSRLSRLEDDLAAIAPRFDALNSEVAASLSETSERLSRLVELRTEALRDSIRELRGDLIGLAGRLPDTGLLLVSLPQQATYVVRANSAQGPVRARSDSNVTVGLHELEPGTYVVTTDAAIQQGRVSVRRGRTTTLWMQPIIIQ